MKIEGSAISLSSSRNYVEEYQKSEKTKFWIGDQRPPDDEKGVNGLSINFEENSAYKLEISEQAKQIVSDMNVKGVENTDEEDTLSSKDQMKIDLIEAFVKVLTGKKIKINIPKKIKIDDTTCHKINIQNVNAKGEEQQPQKAGWGFEYDLHQKYYEKEVTTFQAQGIIKTSDGKEIKIDVNLNMSREFMSQQDISIKAGDGVKCDPLVINYGGHSANITQTKYSFDLDSDGEQENISFAGVGSGFLALDIIDNIL